jgi:hypothetical protein
MVIYWGACLIVAAIIIGSGIGAVLYGLSWGDVGGIAAVAVITWLLGRAALYVLAAR